MNDVIRSSKERPRLPAITPVEVDRLIEWHAMAAQVSEQTDDFSGARWHREKLAEWRAYRGVALHSTAHETCAEHTALVNLVALLTNSGAQTLYAGRQIVDAFHAARELLPHGEVMAAIVRLADERHTQKASDECCCAERGGGLVCTLPKGHAGQHEAWGARKNLLQSWPAMKADPPRGAKARDFVEYDPYGGVRVDMARYLRSPAGQAQLQALGGKKASERQPCSHGNATGHCQHCLDAL